MFHEAHPGGGAHNSCAGRSSSPPAALTEQELCAPGCRPAPRRARHLRAAPRVLPWFLQSGQSGQSAASDARLKKVRGLLRGSMVQAHARAFASQHLPKRDARRLPFWRLAARGVPSVGQRGLWGHAQETVAQVACQRCRPACDALVDAVWPMGTRVQRAVRRLARSPVARRVPRPEGPRDCGSCQPRSPSRARGLSWQSDLRSRAGGASFLAAPGSPLALGHVWPVSKLPPDAFRTALQPSAHLRCEDGLKASHSGTWPI